MGQPHLRNPDSNVANKEYPKKTHGFHIQILRDNRVYFHGKERQVQQAVPDTYAAIVRKKKNSNRYHNLGINTSPGMER